MHNVSAQTKILLATLLFSSACAYGYAGREGKRSTNDPERKTSVKVVTVKEEPDEEPPVETEAPPTKEEPESPCGVQTFRIHYYEQGARFEKTVDCVARKVVDEERVSLAEASYAESRSAGLPEKSWYILVDPKGVRTDYLTNANLLKLSRVFEIDYYGRDANRDLLVYLYTDDPK